MDLKRTISGVLPVLPTIFDDQGVIDFKGMQTVLEYIISAGADGVVFPGLASEYEQLTTEERLDLVKQLGNWIDQRVLFIVGASASSPEEAITHLKSGVDAGSDAAMIMTPHAFADDLDGMVNFYEAVGKTAGMDIILQNAPKPMGVGLSVERVASIVEKVPQISYLKEETPPGGQRITQLTESAGSSLKGLFGGAGGRYIIDEMNRGAHGTMPACEITEIHVALVAAHKQGNIALARELFERSLPVLNMQTIFRWRLTKAVLKKKGLINSTFVRAPGPKFDLQDHEELDSMLELIKDLTKT